MKKEEKKLTHLLEKVDEVFDYKFGGTYYHNESGYDSPPQDGKGNILTTDRGLKEDLRTSEIKSFYHAKIKEIVEEMGKEIIPKKTTNEYWMKKKNIPTSDYSYGHMHGFNEAIDKINKNINKFLNSKK